MFEKLFFKGFVISLLFLNCCFSDSFISQHEHHNVVNKQLHIPIISVSMNTDPKNYTVRMIRSIDYPVDMLIIQVGNSNRKIVDYIVTSIKKHKLENEFIGNISIVEQVHNPGSANGFNFGLRRVVTGGQFDVINASYVLVINNDIAFYPGVLKKISRSVEKSLAHDNKFGIGFTSLCCGGEWSAVVFTRRLVNAVGLFDENFYPAYYEDDDYAIRTHLSEYRASRFNNTPLLHGEIDGSKDYLSGLFTQLYLRPDKSPEVDVWRKAHESGVKRSVMYIESKWGIKTGDFKSKTKLNCKSIEGLNDKCVTGFSTPFNNPLHNLSHWTLSEDTLERIRAGGR